MMMMMKIEDMAIQLLSTLSPLQGQEIGKITSLLTMERRKGMVTK